MSFLPSFDESLINVTPEWGFTEANMAPTMILRDEEMLGDLLQYGI